ncbi:zinc finger protein 518A [Gouania willdenowi]|uniref:Zinc finger protein 518A-like n=1 Tax=Gouania willdenowi TaxID=441366 RepID=A0A8C5E5S8_GOUWI|nr:zinc finger protein 518A-like [Gouania willdenowi]XP_028325363.1 zinc finger protein 518A-like [Gouania willdenowi]
MDLRGATSRGDNKGRVNKKNRDWHKRLHLRKTTTQPPAMQSRDKHGPKKTITTEKQGKGVARPSSQKLPEETLCKTTHGGSTLRFSCFQCQDGLEYVPKDLASHFEEKHAGKKPIYTCHSCPFTTHELSYLQVHLLSHKDTFSSCCICKDNVQRTWAEFSTHLTMCHCPNGQFSCETCHKFSTGEMQVFLEHLFSHNIDLHGAKKEKNQLGSRTASQALCCQHCGFEASQKWLITKHIKVVHGGQDGTQKRKRKEEQVHSTAVKPNDTILNIKPRLTRSAVREMCWLTQDCLSLPGPTFLDKYCHLSDPQTTLEETQQFLMKSVAGKTSDKKWTKALQTVLSNFPHDANLLAKPENGIVSNSSDLTVLTVKNKISVGHNGATYAKRLKMMNSPSKEPVSPERAAGDTFECQSNLSNHTFCPQVDTKSHDNAMSALNEPSEKSHTQENRENQHLKPNPEIKERAVKLEDPAQVDGGHVPSEDVTSICKRLAPKRRPKPQRRRKARFKKKVVKKAPGLPLKLVLKKNPVKEKQWVSQSSLSPSEGGGLDCHCELPESSTGETGLLLTEVQQKTWTKGCKPDLPSESVTSTFQSKPEEVLTLSKDMGGNSLERSLLMPKEIQSDGEKSAHWVSEANRFFSDTSRNDQTAQEASAESLQLQTSHCSTRGRASHDEEASAPDGATLYSNSTSSPLSQPAITLQDETNVESSPLCAPAEQNEDAAEGPQNSKVPPDSCLRLLSSIQSVEGQTIQHEASSPDAGVQLWQPVPKNLERDLKLVAWKSSQLVKCPTGEQPVVVLNHPDADVPEVVRIMQVIRKYKGEVKKVVLSHRTLSALSALNNKHKEADDALNVQAAPELPDKVSVQERFVLKMKFRRLNKKKYEIVDPVFPIKEDRMNSAQYRCWFCGRIFTSHEIWMSHRQRHLMEWNRPYCETLSNVSHTG